MYYPSEHILHTLHFTNARRWMEFQQYQLFMEKQHYFSACDPFGPIKRLAMVEEGKSRQKEKTLTSFRINDILKDADDSKSSDKNLESEAPERNDLRNSCKTQCHKNKHSSGAAKYSNEVSSSLSDMLNNTNSERNFMRPWASAEISAREYKPSHELENPRTRRSCLLKLCNKSGTCDYSSEDEEEIDVEGCDDADSDVSLNSSEKDVSPLDALVAMSSKAFVGLENYEERKRREEDNQNKSQVPKKKRKTRTAFTNQQIYELEKRFILQKYLTPSDRDEIAAKLGLSCAQVITWFQNRRAKFKRDIEEMKHDVVATSPPNSESDCDSK